MRRKKISVGNIPALMACGISYIGKLGAGTYDLRTSRYGKRCKFYCNGLQRVHEWYA